MSFPHYVYLVICWCSLESTCNAGDAGLIPGLGRSHGEGTGYPFQYSWASLVAQMVKNLPATWETRVWSLVGKIPWRRAWEPTSVFLPGESSWTEEPGGLQSKGFQKVRHNSVTKHNTACMSCIPPFIHYFPDDSMVKNPPTNAGGDLGLIPGLEWFPGEGNGNPLQ